MKRLIKIGIIVLVLFVIVGASYRAVSGWLSNRNVPSWRQEKVTQGTIVSVVNSTGTIKPAKLI